MGKHESIEIKAAHCQLDQCTTKALTVPIFEGATIENDILSTVNKWLNGRLEGMLKEGEIQGKWKEVTLIHLDKETPSHLFIVGLGKEKDLTIDKIRSFSAIAGKAMQKIKICSGSFIIPEFPLVTLKDSAKAMSEGLILGLYKFSKYKTKSSKDNSETENKETYLKEAVLLTGQANLCEGIKEDICKGTIIAEATNFTRDLVNEPSNTLTPSYFVEQVKTLLAGLPVEITIIEEKDALNMGMGAFHAVAKGSDEPSKMVVLKYGGQQPKNNIKNLKEFPLAFVGKGITFDSGGISIKPSDQMHTMTSDMAGAAAVLGAFYAIAKLNTPINLLGVIPLTENLPDGKAYKPGDIVKAYNGKTIEVLNTDAEGRLILADALAYAVEQGVHKIVDLATLTAACVIALGHAVSGVFSTSQELTDAIVTAGKETNERAWPMPLLDEYSQAIKGTFADLKNTGGRPAGSGTAAAFLKEFVGDVPWAHLDIAGTSLIEGDKSQYPSYQPESGATGVGVRLLVNLAESISNQLYAG